MKNTKRPKHPETAQRLADLLTKNNTNMSELAVYVGVSPQAVKQWVDGSTAPKGANLKKAAEYLKTTEAHIQFGADKTNQNHIDKVAPNNIRDGYIYLDLLDVQAAAGNGVEMIEHPSVVTKMEIQEEWAQRTFGGDLSRVTLITARGTSMSGTIENGDVLFVDSTVREYDGEGIYVIARGCEVLVKRLQKLHGNRLEIISDNPNNRSETLDEAQADEVIICGRVLKAWTIKSFW